MREIRFFVLFVAYFALLTLIPTGSVYARDYVYDQVNVDITIHKNSLMTVEENMIFKFNGEYGGVFRDIVLTDEANLEACRSNPALQCGGFDYMQIKEVKDNNGNLLQLGEYTEEEYFNSTYSESRLKVQWIFAPDKIYFENQLFPFSIKYDVYGGIGYFDGYQLLYWNALFPDREVVINKATINIHYPSNITYKEEDFKVLSTYEIPFDVKQTSPNQITISASNISPYVDFTVLQKLPENLADKPAKIVILNPNDYFGAEYQVNSMKLELKGNEIPGIPTGETNLKVEKLGYGSFESTFPLKPGEVKEVEVVMEKSIILIISEFIVIGLNILGCIALPTGVIYLFLLWNKKGKDDGGPKTVMPLFEPPDNIPPYLMGTLKDEKVDMIDVTSTIIDLAYRGFVKIIEVKKKGLFSKAEFEFLKLKDWEGLNQSEKVIMDSMFGSNDRVTTTDLTNKFYTKIPTIKEELYDELVTKKYFKERPDKVRLKYLVFGILLLVLGVGACTLVSILIIGLTGQAYGLFTLQCAIGLFGLLLIPLSFFMPARTELGADVLNRIYGFRMFLYYTERFKLQNLTPEMFEKYLSYAIVFGVEKQWAKTFEGIYKGSPSWYEGSGNLNTWLLADSLRSMTNRTTSSMVSSPSSSGHSGGGWSGGGGFSGGFSGGGGGGGGGGAF